MGTDASAASREAASSQIGSLLEDPPTWLDSADPAAALLRLEPDEQRGRGARGSRLAWQWRCSVRAPSDSPYGGEGGVAYRVAVRFPLAYPALPPRLQLLSAQLKAAVSHCRWWQWTIKTARYAATKTTLRWHGKILWNDPGKLSGI